MKHIYLAASLLASQLWFSQSPGGVSGVSLWIKADAGNAVLTQYPDYSGSGTEIPAGPAQNRPSYALLNFNDAMYFDGVDDFIKAPYVFETLNKVSLYTAFQNLDTAGEAAIVTSAGAENKELYLSTANLFRYNNEQINFVDPARVDSTASFVSYTKFDVPSPGIKNVVGTSGQSEMYIGKDAGTRGWRPFRGKLPEMFIYRKVLTQNERDRVNSYMAVKYAITMPMAEYLSSRSVKVWRKEDYSGYPENIAGLARDSYSGLYQKQATSTSEDARLVIAAGTLAQDNKKNKAEFPNHTYLVWGNDKNPLELDKENLGTRMLKRKWKARLTSEAGAGIDTEIRFSTRGIIDSIPPGKTLWLMIDRSGRGSFNDAGIEAVPPSKVSSDGVAEFSNVKFDKDLSGTDVFTFAIGDRLMAVTKLTQPTCTNPAAGMEMEVKGGTAPYTVSLKGARAGSALTATSGSAQIAFSNLAPDEYLADIRDSRGVESSFRFTINDFSRIDLGLYPLERQIKAGEYIELDAAKNITDAGATYRWTSDNGFSSNQPRVKIYQAGRYTATVATADGCSKSETLDITKAADKGITIYPNPTRVGEQFTIRVELERAQDIGIQIFDMAGRLLKARKENGKSDYQITESLNVQGAYVILVTTATERKAFKLIID